MEPLTAASPRHLRTYPEFGVTRTCSSPCKPAFHPAERRSQVSLRWIASQTARNRRPRPLGLGTCLPMCGLLFRRRDWNRFAMALLHLLGSIRHPNHGNASYGSNLRRHLMSGGVVHAPLLVRRSFVKPHRRVAQPDRLCSEASRMVYRPGQGAFDWVPG